MNICSYNGKKPHAFISYWKEDSDRVFPILAQIQKDGYRFWFNHSINEESEWDEQRASRIDDASCLIAFLSENYLNTVYCKNELLHACRSNKHVYIVCLEPIKLTGAPALLLSKTSFIHTYMHEDIPSLCQLLYRCLKISDLQPQLSPFRRLFSKHTHK